MAFNLKQKPNLSSKLDAFPYQLDAIHAVKKKLYSAIFHEQGLGKTKIAIDLVLYWLEEDIVDTVFIITKKSLVKNWFDEYKTHSHIRPRILSDDRRGNGAALNAPALVYILNYEVCTANFELVKLFLKTCRVGAILDESQKIKNPGAKLTASFLALSDSFVRKVIMTGTPVANRPHDIWSQIKFLDGGTALGDNFELFKERIDFPEGTADISYVKELEAIQNKIRDFSIRETKQSVDISLPSKTIVSRPVTLAIQQRKIYEAYKADLAYEFKTEHGFVTDSADNILKRLLRLVQCASNPALIDPTYQEIPAKFTELNDILEKEIPSDEKVIVWTSFINNAIWLYSKLGKYNPAIVHGANSIDDRNAEIDRFKGQLDCRILVATPGSAKEGLTLTIANHAFFYDRSFSLDDYLQAQDRIHRISQDRECYIYNLIAADSIDEWINQLLYKKFKAAQLVQGDMKASQGESIFNCDLSKMLAEILKPQQ